MDNKRVGFSSSINPHTDFIEPGLSLWTWALIISGSVLSLITLCWVGSWYFRSHRREEDGSSY